MSDHNTPKTERFAVIDHRGRKGAMRVVYQCPDCFGVYAEGNFTIESSTSVIGKTERAVCCGKERPPLTFDAETDVRDLLCLLRENAGRRYRSVMIAKSALETAHLNPALVAEIKRQHYH